MDRLVPNDKYQMLLAVLSAFFNISLSIHSRFTLEKGMAVGRIGDFSVLRLASFDL